MTVRVGEVRRWPAPAKLNLFLHVLRRRDDGYHELQTVYQLLDWGDEVSIETTAAGDIERVADIPGVPAEEDLSIRAARLLKSECGVAQGARIAVHKRIPPGKGLGGASSDAATVLRVLNLAWGCGLDTPRLARLGLRLGADVPAFVHGRSAWAGGVGERLQPIPLGDRHYVLLLPDCHVGTASVFADPGLWREGRPMTPGDFAPRFDFSGCRNDCEAVVLRRHPELESARRALAAWGSPRMSGTGSAFFLPVSGANAGRRVTTELKSRYNVRAVTGVDRSPLLAQLAGRRPDR